MLGADFDNHRYQPDWLKQEFASPVIQLSALSFLRSLVSQRGFPSLYLERSNGIKKKRTFQNLIMPVGSDFFSFNFSPSRIRRAGSAPMPLLLMLIRPLL
jgi:hypothetical protein